MNYPDKVSHWINGQEVEGSKKQYFDKINPATGQVLAQVIRGGESDVDSALAAADKAFALWSKTLVVKRGEILRQVCQVLQSKREEIAQIIAVESGKPKRDALAEVDAAIQCGLFMAGEGRRYYGQTLTSTVPNRFVSYIRQSIGVGALIVPFNNPLASIAWKTFPALLCGNSVVLKSHDDTPYVGVWFGKILQEAGLLDGVYNVLQGYGREIGQKLVEDNRVKFISFTGSVATGAKIIKSCADRLAKVSIEAGGKNPIIVCDDADLDKAAETAVRSGFIDAGQRCAAASRLIIFDSIYEEFKDKFISQVEALKVGVCDNDDYGAIINEQRLKEILQSVNQAVKKGANLLTGGKRLEGNNYQNGYFLEPTVLDSVDINDEISCTELFGPVVVLYRAKDFNEAIEIANSSSFKLSGAIFTKSVHRAQEFINRYNAGVARVNGPTHGSEPHMPFGGPGLSGNGWREPGSQALDFYSEWKQVSIDHDSERV